MDYRIFNVRADLNACSCAGEFADIVKESALKVDSGRKIPCRTGELNLHQRRAGPTLYQLSYIPNPAIELPRGVAPFIILIILLLLCVICVYVRNVPQTARPSAIDKDGALICAMIKVRVVRYI